MKTSFMERNDVLFDAFSSRWVVFSIFKAFFAWWLNFFQPTEIIMLFVNSCLSGTLCWRRLYLCCLCRPLRQSTGFILTLHPMRNGSCYISIDEDLRQTHCYIKFVVEDCRCSYFWIRNIIVNCVHSHNWFRIHELLPQTFLAIITALG